MIAVDTNVVVRYLTGDDPRQSARARALIEGAAVFVCTTVLLETEWVLRSVYGYGVAECEAALRGFAALPTVRLENAGLARQALAWMGEGVDFADGLHLAASSGCDAFATFDRSFARAANRLGAIPVHAP